MSRLQPLPIDDALPSLLAALRATGRAVVVAPPGSGKTTRVPGAILDARLAGAGQVVVLQPRRVAARLAARRVAWERGGKVGEEVGYQLRFERRMGSRTRIAFLTEGLLLRRLQDDPFLEGVGCVVLDELHERSLQVDLALALLREVCEGGRDDLRLVVMSATLDPDPVVDFLGGEGACPVVRAEGRRFPVEHRYLERPDDLPLERRCARAVRRALGECADGHVLVFLPGVAEIERVATALGRPEGVRVLPLHGRLSGADQDRALEPSAQRKVVLATNIAQTSVTLDGVCAVVDSGLVRMPRLDPALGLERLVTARIARDAAGQRAGRAGRTGPGVAYRLWTRPEQNLLEPATPPELGRTDLCSTVLSLRAWGTDPASFGWFEAPPAAALLSAQALLQDLGALDSSGQLTSLGRRMEALPVHPRLARVVAAGHADGQLEEAAALAALASERDPLREPSGVAGGSDLDERLAALVAQDAGVPVPHAHRGALRQVGRVWRQLQRLAARALGPEPTPDGPSTDRLRAAWLLAGFPDRVACLREQGGRRYRMVGGRGLRLLEGSAAEGAALILAVSLRAARRGARAEHLTTVAVALEPAWLERNEEDELGFDPEREAVVARRVTLYRDLELAVRPAVRAPDPAAVAAVLEAEARSRPERALRMGPDAAALLDRIRFLAYHLPELGWPDLSDLRALLPELCFGKRSFADLRDMPWRSELLGRLAHPQRQALERDAPVRFTVPSGSSVGLRYPDTGGVVENAWARGEDPAPPVLAARIQQLFGLLETPLIARGRVPLLVHLLAPNQRPAQITRDLGSFWRETYLQVRKDLRGRYPKHAWPEDPLTAQPEDRPRRRRPT